MPWYKQLHWQIIIGMIAGLLYGLGASQIGLNQFTIDWIKPVGTIFVNLLKLIAVPLVLASLVVGISNLSDIRKLSRLGGKTIGIYMVTTVFAISIGLILVNIVQPGNYLPLEVREDLMTSYAETVAQKNEDAEVIMNRGPLAPVVDMFPTNFFAAASNNINMLQVVVVAVLIGIGLVKIPVQEGQALINFFESLNAVIIKIVDMIMSMAPYAVFALMGALIAELAGDDPSRAGALLLALLAYMATVITGLFFHGATVYYSLLRIFSKMPLFKFFAGIRPAMLLGFSTSSSSATLPVTMEQVEKKLGVHEEVSSFVLPVGSTINMDGTSMYQAIAAVFIAQALGMELTIVQQLTIVLTATLASIGAAGVPGAGIVMLVIVLNAIGVPTAGIALIIGVDRLLDMCRTTLNITGDAAVSVAVAASEGMLKDPAAHK